jgi:catechol 2,3-dioxygenase-like lactoylglutathione lyase family enzyme
MMKKFSHVTVLVKDQDEALRWYTEKLGFTKKQDEAFGPGVRWLTVAVPGDELEVVLQKPDDERLPLVGKGTPWVIDTDDCRADYDRLRTQGVEFPNPPSEMPWGTSAVFRDLYGNTFNLVQRR